MGKKVLSQYLESLLQSTCFVFVFRLYKNLHSSPWICWSRVSLMLCWGMLTTQSTRPQRLTEETINQQPSLYWTTQFSKLPCTLIYSFFFIFHLHGCNESKTLSWNCRLLQAFQESTKYPHHNQFFRYLSWIASNTGPLMPKPCIMSSPIYPSQIYFCLEDFVT